MANVEGMQEPDREREAYLRGLREARDAVQAEQLEDYPDNDSDRGYAAAVWDCTGAVAALIAKAEAERGDSDGG